MTLTKRAAELAPAQIDRRAAIAAWLNKRDTAIAEFWSGAAQLIVGWRAVDIFEGKPSAPFTGSALLRFSGGFWFYALVVCGVATLIALTIGLLSGNTYRLRSYVSLASCAVWSAVAVATLTAPGPPSVAIGFCIPAVIAIFSAVVLFVRADLKEKASRVVEG